MAIVIEDVHMERLAEQMASAEGVSIADVVREGLLCLAGHRGVTAPRPPLRARLAALAGEIDGVPKRLPADTRSDNEILGYDEHGAW